ncbi:hypothetical protein [Streptomyces sp. NBC_00236]|uniref:hypothetical protein n=1 Tax=unclassified Streptomyces TaxID=2593676 RepID=UPI002E2D9816|nr:hypothetical protein [Streptomyces sp. NBC_00236]
MRERAARSAATLVPIVGPRNLSQLDSYLGALDVQLTDEQYTRLTDVSAVPLGAPHEGIAASLDPPPRRRRRPRHRPGRAGGLMGERG